MGDLYMTPSQFFPDSEPHMWQKPGAWNAPGFLIPAGESVHGHTHVLEDWAPIASA